MLFVGYILAVIVLYFVLDLAIGKLFDECLFLKNDPQMQYAYQGGGGEEIAVLGASRAVHHYNPAVIEKDLGVKCYNYGMDGRNIFNQYVVANELLTRSSILPRIIILEIASIDINDAPGYNSEKLSNLNVLYKNNEAVRDIINRENPEMGFALKKINLYRYNSNIFGNIRGVLFGHSNDMKGYIPLNSVWNKDATAKIEKEDDGNYYQSKELYLRKLIHDCLASGVQLFIFNSPEYYTFERPRLWEEKIESICNEYNIPFFNHAHDSFFMEHREWFNEPFHLNNIGAKVYTSMVCNEVKEFMSNFEQEEKGNY